MRGENASDYWNDGAATFGDRLAAARHAAGLSQADLAARLGVSRRALKAWEEDRAEPRANRLQMLAGLLGVSVSWLLTGQGAGLSGPPEEARGASLMALVDELRGLRDEQERIARRMAEIEAALVARATAEDA